MRKSKKARANQRKQELKPDFSIKTELVETKLKCYNTERKVIK